MSEQLAAALDDARYVKYDPDGYVLAWFGAHGVHIYDTSGTEVDYFTLGDFAQPGASLDDVRESCARYCLGRMIDDETEGRLVEIAREEGATDGQAAASWVFDGNTSDETYTRVLVGLDEGDPAILDSFPQPDLSGEWADGRTPQSLVANVCSVVGVDAEDLSDEQSSSLCDAYEDGFRTAIEATVADIARRSVSDIALGRRQVWHD